MSYGELNTKKEKQLTKEIRVGSDYHADRLKRSNRELFDQAAIERDISDINEVLEDEELNLEAEERARLETVKGRNLSSLLILDEKTTGDSKEMKNVKKTVAAIEGKLNEACKAPLTVENVDALLKQYDAAILACRDYLREKNSSYDTGMRRRDRVNMNMVRLHTEAEAFLTAKELLRSGVINGQVSNARELLVIAKVYGIGNPAGLPEGEEEKRKAPTEAQLKKAGREAGILYRAFSGKETPADLIARLSKSKSKTERMYARQLPALFANIRSSLSEFKEGKVAAKVFLFGNDVLSVHQNAFGQLSMRAGGMDIPLERHTGVMADILARDIVKNKETYGKKEADRVIRDAVKNVDFGMENTEKRQLLTDYLAMYTEYPATAFSNFYTNDLAGMVRLLFQGKKIRIIKEELLDENGKFEWELMDNEVLYLDQGQSLVNVSESRELLQRAQAQENREKVKSQVTMKHKEVPEPEVQPEAKAQKEEEEEEEEEKKEGEWSKKEEKIKNLLADILFSYETWIADEKVNEPGGRMRLMLEKNSEAVAYLLEDMYRSGQERQSMINRIIEQLPLSILSDEETVKFKQSLSDTIDSTIKEINEQIGERAKKSMAELMKKNSPDAVIDDEKLEEIVGGKALNKAIAHDKHKVERDRKRAEEAAKREADLEKGIEESWSAYMDRLAKEGAENAKDLAEDAKYLPVKPILWHLSNADALLKGNEALGIPDLKEILKDMDTNTFAEKEASLDAGVNTASEMIQNTVNSFTGELFKGEQKKEEAPLPNPYERGIDEETKKERMRKRIRLGNERLNKMTKDSVQSGESGLGLFTKLVFEQYFTGVDTLDKRSMIASMIRNAKPVGKLLDENDKALDKDDPALATEELVNRLKEGNLPPEELENITNEVERRAKEKDRRIAEKEKRHKANEKVRTEAMANYIGGMLKGAGPLFQKMMQGLPTEGIPEELKGAIQDMKSKLAPIPDEIVEAELNNIVVASHDQIKNIQVLKSLGAASVGQTFLCKITRSDGTEEETAIKLLKPDVRNRMMREKQLMINCARLTDIKQREKDNAERREKGKNPLPALKENEKGGMQVTYEGQLERIEEELDLTIEARNVELGSIYDREKEKGDDKVVSMKLNTLIAPSTNSMVLEKAPGETIDSLLDRIKTEAQKIRDVYKKDGVISPDLDEKMKKKYMAELESEPYFIGPTDLELYKGIKMYSKEWDAIQPGVLQEKLANYLVELKKKKRYLDAFAKKWTVEGMFGEGFYHGDPHEGNIMVDDEKLTVIDFGNCTRLSDDQKLQVTRMLAAAAIGDMDTFRHGFHMLLKPEFEELYQQKRTELGNRIKEIFSLGDKSAAGSRIAVALLEAQKLGLEVPSSVYNFSQGQMRLQNAIDHFNTQIRDTQEQLEDLYNAMQDGSHFDLTDETMTQATNFEAKLELASNAYKKDMITYSNDREDLKRFAFGQTKAVCSTYMNSIRAQSAEIKGTIDHLKQSVKIAREMPNHCDSILQLESGLFNSKIGFFADQTTMEELHRCIMSPETGDEAFERLERRLMSFKEDSDAAVAAFDAMVQKKQKILGKHGDKWKPTEREQAEYDALSERFADAVLPVHEKVSMSTKEFKRFFSKLTGEKDRTLVRDSMDAFFRMHPEGREEFMPVYLDFLKAQDEKLGETDPAAFAEKREALSRSYLSVMQRRLKEKEKLYSEAAAKCDKDFPDIMSDIIDDYIFTMGKRLGLKSISFKWAMDAQLKQEKYLNEDADNND